MSTDPKTPSPAGLYRKYDVRKLNDPEHTHDECRFFVLDLTHDPAARAAAVAYARSIGNDLLADDLEQG